MRRALAIMPMPCVLVCEIAVNEHESDREPNRVLASQPGTKGMIAKITVKAIWTTASPIAALHHEEPG